MLVRRCIDDAAQAVTPPGGAAPDAKDVLLTSYSGYRLAMVACYRSGQQHRALEAFAALRRTLIDELGLEPSAGTREMHQQILSADHRLDEPTPVAVAGGASQPARPMEGAA
jgi:hypothetical protein